MIPVTHLRVAPADRRGAGELLVLDQGPRDRPGRLVVPAVVGQLEVEDGEVPEDRPFGGLQLGGDLNGLARKFASWFSQR